MYIFHPFFPISKDHFVIKHLSVVLGISHIYILNKRCLGGRKATHTTPCTPLRKSEARGFSCNTHHDVVIEKDLSFFAKQRQI